MPAAPLLAAFLACPPCAGGSPPPPLPVEAVVLGSRPDRLSAYTPRLPAAFPAGVPTDEAGFALHLLRAERAAGLLGGGGFAPPPPVFSRGPVGPTPAGSISVRPAGGGSPAAGPGRP